MTLSREKTAKAYLARLALKEKIESTFDQEDITFRPKNYVSMYDLSSSKK